MTAQDKIELENIHKSLSEANEQYEALSQEIKDEIQKLHHENYSLGHCLRWGERAIIESREELKG